MVIDEPLAPPRRYIYSVLAFAFSLAPLAVAVVVGIITWDYYDPLTGVYVWPYSNSAHTSLRYCVYLLILAGVVCTFISFYRNEDRSWYKYGALFLSLFWLAALTYVALMSTSQPYL